VSVTPPFTIKNAPDGEVPPLPPVTVAREPVMTIAYPHGCLGVAELTLDTMPVMDRDPEALPDIPGGGHSYDGCCLEYLEMGIALPFEIEAKWSGRGAESWAVMVDGYQLATINEFDGTAGPITVSLAARLNWKLPHEFWLAATYNDRPGYREFYMGTGVGVGAFAPSGPPCSSSGSIFWNSLDYWDAWVGAHHDVADTLGPKDRLGAYLGLTGPWGSDVPKQHLATDPAIELCLSVGVPDGSAFAATLTDLTLEQAYSAVSYPIESAHQLLPPCAERVAYPIFRTRHKASR
jgi:hypothetical protein